MSDKFKPTASQEKAINERGHEIVVSAAAGSGKTTVLINRIIKMIIDGECSVDEILIVTFTRAATAEIRSRLATAIIEKLKEDPKNERLIKQQMLVPSANIYTIDAFCANLVRENFETAKVAPDFKILEGGLQISYQKQALEQALAFFYEENSEALVHLDTILSKGYGTSLETYVETIYSKIQAYRYPLQILDSSIDLYRDGTNTIDLAVNNFLNYADYLISGMEKGRDHFATEEKIVNIINEDLVYFKEVREHIKNKDFEKAFAVKYEKIPPWTSKFEGGDSFEAINLKYYRDTANEFLKKGNEKLKKHFAYGDKYLNGDLTVQLPALEKLLELVKLYDQYYKAIKTEKNCLDFSDMEHIAFNLLINADGSKTELAKDLSNSFKQILIDEYQDTNELQDGIFTALSDNLKNLFIVGDVKQSIYGFRNAMPELFIEKKTHEGGITLGENFRSSAGVIDFVNFVFDQVMTSTCGDINYQDKSERLEHGKDDEEDPNRVDVELHIFEGKGNSLIYETNYIIKYIKAALLENKDLSYADFAILMRSVKNRGQVVIDLLEKANIPVIFDGGSEFLETADVKVMVSLLHAIDNPLLDVHLLAALMSPIFGFTPDDMAELKLLNNKKGSLYTNLIHVEKDNEKFKSALDTIRRYRQLSVTMPVGELIRLIYDETLYPDIAASMPNGIQREANLLLLRDYADSFEQSNEVGIGSFVRYLDDLIENQIDPESASLVSGSTNAVKLMTIHKSKGLEFKYCFLIDLGKTEKERTDPLIIGEGFNIGIKACNAKTLDVLPSFVYSQIKNGNIFKDKSEELRILYVGMTRAKEKLIMLGSVGTKADEKIAKAIAPADLDPKTKTLMPYAVAEASSLLNIILMAAARHPFFTLYNADSSILSKMPIKASIEQGEDEIDEEIGEELPTSIDDKMLEEIKVRQDYEYPYAPLANIPTKRSASMTEALGFNEHFFATKVPEFMTSSKLTATQKGTCLHRFMQYADFENAKRDPEDELLRLKQKGYFTDKEAATIDLEKIKNFFDSDIYKRLEKSPHVMREKKFAVLIPAEEFNADLPEELKHETVLIQGIADCVFEENGEYVILDYKTDKTRDREELIATYKDQLFTYKRSLSDVLDKPVTSTYLYSFSLGEEIET